MVEFCLYKVHYLETDCRGSKDKYIEPPLPIARDVGNNANTTYKY